MIGDDRLRLVFICCHPALARESQLALTLRLVCGVATADVAHAFLVSEATMAARITRAKKKIAAARIPYVVPEPDELPARLDAALTVIYLLYTTGHTAPAGDDLVRDELTARGLDLARMLHALLPGGEAAGLLALLLCHEARRGTRTDADGRLLRLAEQDRSRWDRERIAEADALIVGALRAGGSGRFLLQAAIAALHAQAPSSAETDWPQILELYDALLRVWPSPVVALNRAVALAEVEGPQAALRVGRRARRPGRLPLPALHPRRPALPFGPPRRGGGRLPGRARAHRQHRRTRVPRSDRFLTPSRQFPADRVIRPRPLAESRSASASAGRGAWQGGL